MLFLFTVYQSKSNGTSFFLTKKALPIVNDSVKWYKNVWMLKFNMLHIITNLQEYCGQLCEYQIRVYCILYFGNLYLKAKILVIVGILGEKGIKYLLSNNEKCNKLPYLCLMSKGVWNIRWSFMRKTLKEWVSTKAGTRLFYVCSEKLSAHSWCLIIVI